MVKLPPTPLIEWASLLRPLQPREATYMEERSPTPSPAGKAACVDEKSIRRQYPCHRRDEPQSGRSRRQNVPRHGLHCRINAFPLSIPQLAARRGDVELLADHFLHTFSAALGKHMQAINAETRDLLCRYPWPGNVREQENAIGLAVNVCGGQELMPCGFPSAMFRYGPASGPGRKNGWLWMQETKPYGRQSAKRTGIGANAWGRAHSGKICFPVDLIPLIVPPLRERKGTCGC